MVPFRFGVRGFSPRIGRLDFVSRERFEHGSYDRWTDRGGAPAGIPQTTFFSLCLVRINAGS